MKGPAESEHGSDPGVSRIDRGWNAVLPASCCSRAKVMSRMEFAEATPTAGAVGRRESVLYSGGRSRRSAKNSRDQLLQTLPRLAVSCVAPGRQCPFGDTPS